MQNKCVQKVAAKFEANSMHACLTPFVIKRNWWQQPKSFEQKKGKTESGSIAVAVDKNAVKFDVACFLSHPLHFLCWKIQINCPKSKRVCSTQHFPSSMHSQWSDDTTLPHPSIPLLCFVHVLVCVCSDFSENLMT